MNHPVAHAPQHDALARHCRDIIEGRSSLASLGGLDAAALEAIYARGYDAWNAGDLDAATSDFGFLVLQQPRDRRFHFAFACALQQQGELHHALAFFSYAASMQADDPFAVFHIGECLLRLDEIEGARDALDAAIALCYGQADKPGHHALRLRAEDLLAKLNH